ncbi:unnamed protein product [Lactuca virosa]|uniref:Uncharacterized protein n=1 Tax=Lactuca virosa TaxID=75947 RepID=A0AAU9NQ85_9ASTR|nr:unnamed protein product [Lactuca virosa]
MYKEARYLIFFLTLPSSLHSLFSSGHQRTHASILSPSTRRTSQRTTADHRIPSSSHTPPPSQASVARTVDTTTHFPPSHLLSDLLPSVGDAATESPTSDALHILKVIDSRVLGF